MECTIAKLSLYGGTCPGALEVMTSSKMSIIMFLLVYNLLNISS